MEYQVHKQVSIPVGRVAVNGDLILPEHVRGIVIFSHGSGSSRFSPRNRQVAEYLHGAHFGTLLFDLLTAQEDAIYRNLFDIELLTERPTSPRTTQCGSLFGNGIGGHPPL